jgi:sec-independent protein translocase protein TatA
MLPFGIGVTEMILLAIVAVMLFGGRLPEVAKQLGESYVQFRRGLDDIKSSINTEIDLKSNPLKSLPDYSSGSSVDDDQLNDDYEEPSAPVFTPPVEDEA